MPKYKLVMVNKRDRIRLRDGKTTLEGSIVNHAVGGTEQYRSRGQGVVHDQETRRAKAHRYGWMKYRHQIASAIKPVQGEWTLLPTPRQA